MSAVTSRRHIKGWSVVKRITTKKGAAEIVKWKPVTRVYTVHDAAVTYLDLARKAEPAEVFEIETVYTK